MKPYLQSIQIECEALGISVTFREKIKSKSTPIHSAFPSMDTQINELVFESEGWTPGKKERITLKVKLEIDLLPPLGFSTEEKLMIKPFSCYVRCFAFPDMMAGKIHAILYRNWKNRVKGRDWYDLEWFIQKGTHVHLEHFRLRAIHSGHWEPGLQMSPKDLIDKLEERIELIDFSQAKEDVKRFIKDSKSLSIWSAPYFIDLVQQIKIQL